MMVEISYRGRASANCEEGCVATAELGGLLVWDPEGGTAWLYLSTELNN